MTTEKVEEMVKKEEVFQGLKDQPDTYKRVQENVQKSQDKIAKRKLSQGTDDSWRYCTKAKHQGTAAEGW